MLVCVRRARYRCLACDRTFLQPLPDMATGHRLTMRLAAYVAALAFTRSWGGIAREVGINERTVRALRRMGDGNVRLQPGSMQ